MEDMTMPAYRLNRGPRFGEVINLPQSQEIHLAALLGDIIAVAEEVPAVDPLQPRWAVSLNAGGSYFIQLTVGAQVMQWDGYPEDAPTAFQRKNWKGDITGHATPQHIMDDYKAKRKFTAEDHMRLTNGRKA